MRTVNAILDFSNQCNSLKSHFIGHLLFFFKNISLWNSSKVLYTYSFYACPNINKALKCPSQYACPWADNVVHVFVKTWHFLTFVEIAITHSKKKKCREKLWPTCHILTMFNSMIKIGSEAKLLKWISIKEIDLVEISISCELNQNINTILEPLCTNALPINPFTTI